VPTIQTPDYQGGSLVNLVAELEQRLTGTSPTPPLYEELSRRIPAAESYILLLVDGLGDHQLAHPAAGALRAGRRAAIDAPFPTTTTVAWASVATGMSPYRHGLIGYQLLIPEAGGVVSTIKWRRLWGDEVRLDHDRFLPEPNLWERLTAAGCEPITVQPGNFTGSPLSRTLFRGCRFEPAYTADELVAAALQLATVPRRLVVTYIPHVDVAAHMHGQASPAYSKAIQFAAGVWSGLADHLPPGVALVGTSDHGHVDYPQSAATIISPDQEDGRILYGDSRVMFVRGDGAALASQLPARWVPLDDMRHWWGPGPAHPQFAARAPDGVLVADGDHVIHHRFSDHRMVGHHGGLTDEERIIPILVARS